MVQQGTQRFVLERGVPVVTSDGATLGSVGETRPQHFKVESSGEADYWLLRECVTEASPERVVVGFDTDEQDQYRLTDPGAPGVVPGGPRGRPYLPGATPEEANELYDPKFAREGASG